MSPARPKVGVMLTLLDLYRRTDPEMPGKLAALWRRVIEGALSESAELHFTGPAHTGEEAAAAVASCEEAGCDLLMVLPMAYATSGNSRDALCATGMPLLVVSTARDATLPWDMTLDHIMANHAMHGVQDLANVLSRSGRGFELIAGHFADGDFRRRLLACVRAAAGARVLRRGRVGRIGRAFEGMLDFSYDADVLARMPLLSGGFTVIDIEADAFARGAREFDDAPVAELVRWSRESFDVDSALTDEELAASARCALAIEDLAAEHALDALSMNFLDLAAAGAETMPFLGASRLLSQGVGYAGEGDVLTAALVAATARMAGEATFTEMFCPDYERGQVLLSHMGECNFALASPARRVKLLAKDFHYGRCARPAVTVFQLKPGAVTLASLTEWPGAGVKLVVAPAQVVEAPEHPNLSSPYTRIAFGRELPGFLEQYSRAGGTHHLALAYGDLRAEFERLSGFCGLDFEAL